MRHAGFPVGIGLAALAAAAYALYRSARSRRPAPPGGKPEYLQTWEEEGGSIPSDAGRTAAQVYAESANNGSRPGA